jgi:hypothetical protein
MAEYKETGLEERIEWSRWSLVKLANTRHCHALASTRDHLLHSILSSNPVSLYSAIRQFKSAGSPGLYEIHVEDDLYTGQNVPD